MLPIPRNLAETAARVGRDDLNAWVSALPAVVAEMTERWDVRLDPPYEPGGQCSWVAPAQNAAGDELVLKVGWRHPEAAHEADALRTWDGCGAVRLHAAETFDQTIALLLERCTPGTPLGHSIPEPEQDVIVAGLLRRLWTVRPGSHAFRPLWSMCDEWAAEFERDFTRAPSDVDPGLAREAMTLFRELPRATGHDALLCTDLHAENILAAEREPWLVVDPKPYLGDPAYDALRARPGDRRPQLAVRGMAGPGPAAAHHRDPDAAIAHHGQALALAGELGHPLDQARAHDGLAHTHRVLDQHEQAREHWQHALDILIDVGIDYTDEEEGTVAAIRTHLALIRV